MLYGVRVSPRDFLSGNPSRAFKGFEEKVTNPIRSALLASDTEAAAGVRIVKLDDNKSRIDVVATGLSKNEIEITVENGVLSINGSKHTDDNKVAHEDCLHDTIPSYGVSKKIALDEYDEVDKACLSKGVLSVHITENIPEKKKPRVVSIS